MGRLSHRVAAGMRSPRRAWLVFESRGHEVVQFDGPLLELITEGALRFDQRLAEPRPGRARHRSSTRARFLARLRVDDQSGGIGDALLDQRNVAGIGNAWKAEGCWGRRSTRGVRSVRLGCRGASGNRGASARGCSSRLATATRAAGRRVFRRRAALPAVWVADPQSGAGPGHDNRTTFWCPGCHVDTTVG